MYRYVFYLSINLYAYFRCVTERERAKFQVNSNIVWSYFNILHAKYILLFANQHWF